ncbi:MAG: PIN domain-containing protein [Candidatus Sulfotelmatobacter sp.]
MKLAVDTNVLAYAEGVNGPVRRESALEITGKLPAASTVVPVQVLGELYRVLVGKAAWPAKRARAAILSWQDTFPLIETSPSVLVAALDVADHGLSIWDAIILSAAAAAGCRLLLSEDLQEGFTWGGVTVVNPFAAKKHELLAGLLEE